MPWGRVCQLGGHSVPPPASGDGSWALTLRGATLIKSLLAGRAKIVDTILGEKAALYKRPKARGQQAGAKEAMLQTPVPRHRWPCPRSNDYLAGRVYVA